MMRYALIDATGLVVNVVLWDGLAEWAAPDGLTLEPAPDHVGPGWRKDGGEWIAPEPIEPA
jgi:hypothetical protein